MISRISSPTPEEASMSLNLTRGMMDHLPELETYDEDDLIWKEASFLKDFEYLEDHLQIFRENIEAAYKELFGGCFINKTIVVQQDGKISFGEHVYSMQPNLLSAGRSESVFNAIQKCILNENVRLICIMVYIIIDLTNSEAHLCTLIINKVHDTVEFYDPNGRPPNRRVNSDIYKFLAAGIPEMERFSPVLTTENNLEHGFQYYQHGYVNKYCDRGLCQTWAFYIAQLRAEYIDDTPYKFKKRCGRRLRELIDYYKNRYGREDSKWILGRYLTNYILSYLLHAEENMSYRQKRGSTRKRPRSPTRSRSRSRSPSPQRLRHS